MKYFFILIILICFGCNKSTLKLIDRKGNLVNAERRMPVYNEEMLAKQREFKKSRIRPINNYRSDEDGSGGKYFSTQQLETPVMSKDFQKIKTLAPIHKKNNISNNSEANLQQENRFVSLSEININENKNVESTKKLLLDRQNIVTNSEYKPKKSYNIVIPKKSAIKKSFTITNTKKIDKFENEKPKPPTEIIIENKPYFIRIAESKDLGEISDKIKEIKSLTNATIAIEQNKKRGNYQLIIGPISNKTETKKILGRLQKLRYSDVVVLS